MVQAESPQEASRKAMELSVANQRRAVAAMQVSIEKQRVAVSASQPGTGLHASSAGGTSADAASGPFFVLSWPALGTGCDPLSEIELTPMIQQAAQREGLDANLLRAVAHQESGFRTCAVSQKAPWD